ncbi:hypothetical protein JM64_01675 [Fervidobacterium ngatamarikiense]|uniref:O-antigen ligase-related domain-containing protein n=1 Tax=Fervidobacterium pennivorans TaxID=93466 RepID=A0A172T1I6_FERPE|nr:O-antigen ligase family protein [Fervidobacterium pennivorans]ANE40857.1 hypothetical protein JM64_01675 [Fervidobacterium pennivorans]
MPLRNSIRFKRAKIEQIRVGTYLEWILIVFLLGLSLYNKSTLYLFFALLLAFLKQKEVGAIKALNIITYRTILNPALATDIGILQGIKWIYIFALSTYLILSYFKLGGLLQKKVNRIMLPIFLFFAYNLLVSFFVSSLPLVAIGKLVSYVYVFLAIIIGVAYTKGKIDWLNWVDILFKSIVILSVFLIPSPIGRVRNGISFQGITNQPNMLGIVLAIAMAIHLTNYIFHTRKTTISFLSFTSLYIYMLFLTRSRTSIMTVFTLLILFMLFMDAKSKYKFALISVTSAILVIFVYFSGGFTVFVRGVLYKQGDVDILYSRQEQISTLIANFKRSPIIGNGFAVPVLPYRSFAFSHEFIVEPGNLVLAVLSYSGIIGLTLLTWYLWKIISSNKHKARKLFLLPLSTILVSMGEMVFFSTNNIGIWLYMCLALYIWL